MNSKIQEINRLRAEYEARLAEMGKEALSEEFAAFFKANPNVTCLTWTQYTPYFNDGETCYFRVGDLNVRIGGEPVQNVCKYPAEDFYETTDEQGGAWDYAWGKHEEFPEDIRPQFAAAKELFDSIGQDILEQMYGDHAQVVVTPGGIEVKRVSHD